MLTLTTRTESLYHCPVTDQMVTLTKYHQGNTIHMMQNEQILGVIKVSQEDGELAYYCEGYYFPHMLAVTDYLLLGNCAVVYQAQV